MTILVYQFKGKDIRAYNESNYRLVNHNSVISSVCEIVLSKEKPILTDLMGSTHSSSFEDVYLLVNKVEKEEEDEMNGSRNY